MIAETLWLNLFLVPALMVQNGKHPKHQKDVPKYVMVTLILVYAAMKQLLK